MEIALVDTLHRIHGDRTSQEDPAQDQPGNGRCNALFLFAFAHFVYFIDAALVASCICNRCAHIGAASRFECVDAHLGRIGPEYDVYRTSGRDVG